MGSKTEEEELDDSRAGARVDYGESPVATAAGDGIVGFDFVPFRLPAAKDVLSKRAYSSDS